MDDRELATFGGEEVLILVRKDLHPTISGTLAAIVGASGRFGWAKSLARMGTRSDLGGSR